MDQGAAANAAFEETAAIAAESEIVAEHNSEEGTFICLFMFVLGLLIVCLYLSVCLSLFLLVCLFFFLLVCLFVFLIGLSVCLSNWYVCLQLVWYVRL